MLREIRSDLLYCYRDDKKRFYEEIGCCLLAFAAGILLIFVVIGIWG